ncbi:MAG TPA: ABC transporter ATP-binding protein [Thermoplasmata archaeon]|nr:ABC transporter ATP-binding protein [Thermoplasmata archaeon]
MIRTKDLIKVYKTGKLEVIALRGVDLEIGEGEIAAIRGPSGCGKTTLLNLLGGLDRPTAGQIEVSGVNVAQLPEAELVRYRRSRVGVVFQFFNLVPTLTAEENVELPMRLSGKVVGGRTMELLKLVGMEKRAAHKPDELSGGEQQRVAIAMALANDPPLLLADEPTGELDSKTGQEVLSLFHDLSKEQGKTLVIVTHEAAVSHIADREIDMIDGRVVKDAAAVAPRAG